MGKFFRKPDKSRIRLPGYEAEWDDTREKDKERERLEAQKKEKDKERERLEAQKRQLYEEKRKIKVREKEKQERRRREEERNKEIDKLKQEHPGEYAAYLANLTYGSGRSH